MTSISGDSVSVLIKGVLYVPKLASNTTQPVCRLISQMKMQQNSGCCLFYSLSDGSKIILNKSLHIPLYHPPGSSLFYLQTVIIQPKNPASISVDHPSYSTGSHALFADKVDSDPVIWHQRLGHMSKRGVKQTLTALNMAGSIPDLSHDHFCTSCAQFKGTVTPVPKTLHPKPVAPFERVGSDIWSLKTPSLRGHRYVLGFTDYATSFTFVHLMQSKGEIAVLAGLQKFLRFVASHGYTVHYMRMDNDAVFTGTSFQRYLENEHIIGEFTAPYSPFQNGLQERTWRTLSEAAFCMVQQAGLKMIYWEFAVLTAAYIYNRTWKSGCNAIPYKLVFGNDPDLSNLRVFGCPCFLVQPPSLRIKEQGRSIPGVFVGYSSNSPAWTVYLPSTNSVQHSRSVIFDEYFNSDLLNIESAYVDWRLERISAARQHEQNSRLSFPPIQLLTLSHILTMCLILCHIHRTLQLPLLLFLMMLPQHMTLPLIPTSSLIHRSHTP